VTTTPEHTSERAPPTTATYVYGVVRSGSIASVSADGVSGAPVAVLDGDGVAALVSDLPTARLRVRRNDLRRHLDVIEEAFRATTTLPCRFGTVLDSHDRVRGDLLTGSREHLLRGLAQLDDRVQLNVKATYDQELLLRGVVARSPGIARLRDGIRELGAAAYAGQLQLGELVAAAVAEQRDADAARIVMALNPHADDVAIDEPPQESALKASFLVARDRIEGFDRALEDVAAAEQPTLHFDVIGPLPPTAFASAAVEA
jgi:gas vesicle protein GvpL/GvpF